jgi:uncharacterized membrane protein
MLPPTVLAAGSPLAASRTVAPTGAAGAGEPSSGGVLGATFTLPGLGSGVTNGHGGGLVGFVLVMSAIAALAIATLLVHGGRVLLLRARKP